MVSKKQFGFQISGLHKHKQPSPLAYLKERTSFWVAALSLVAFVTGNMVGQNGWQVFWRSVLGSTDDSLIVYTGTVSPVALVPDYEKWAQYGGNSEEHTFRQVPQDALRPLPEYTKDISDPAYSVAHLGSYASGGENSGSHPGVDIRMPVGTPIRSIANGIVSTVKADPSGYGLLVVVRHPNVPDPSNSNRTTTIHSVYAHLNSALVREGDFVNKGQEIAYSGKSGNVSGPHLHFQIDRDDAPYHPYWPFTYSEAKQAGLNFTTAVNSTAFQGNGERYTISPMLYVQSHFSTATTTVADRRPAPTVTPSVDRPAATPTPSFTDRSAQRLAERLSRQRFAQRTVVQSAAVAVSQPKPAPVQVVATADPITTVTTEPVEQEEVVKIAVVESAPPKAVQSAQISHDGSFAGRGWEKVRITLVDADGNTVTNPSLARDITLRTAYGEAEFRPSTLSALDFDNGQTTVQMLPRGRRTIVIEAIPFGVTSGPMKYEE